MSIIVINGLDNRTTGDTVKHYCQKFGRILNCYMKSSQCFLTFANQSDAEEFLRSSPHRIDSNGLVEANWKCNTTVNSTLPDKHSTKPSSIEQCRLTVRGTAEQLNEKSLIEYFSRFGHIRMCISSPLDGIATLTFDDRIGYARALNESKHFLNGRSLIVEQYNNQSMSKRMKTSNEQNLQTQYEQIQQTYENEKQQWSQYLIEQQTHYQQQIMHYQQLLQQSINDILLKDKQIEQLKQENKDIDDLLRQSVHDNDQQQIHLRKREDVHNQTKRKYEELYKSYMKLKDNCSISTDKQANFLANKPKSTIENMSSSKCQLIIRNLTKRTTSKQLEQYASRYGSIVDCYLTDNSHEGFIEFADRTSVDVFMDKRPHTIDGNELHCQRCLPSYELQKPVKRIFLRGTVQQLTDERLENYFNKYGKVLSCTIPKGKRNNTFTHFGYAFVAFDDEDTVDRIIQDKPHFIDNMEIEVQKAEDLTRNNHNNTNASRRSVSPINNMKRSRRDSLSPSASMGTVKRMSRSFDDFPIRQLEEENRRLREHAIMSKHHFDETIWKLRRELDEERRRYDQLKIEYDYARRDLARLTTEFEQKSSSNRFFNSNNSKSSRY